jgi:hypothetical protein
VTEADQTVTSSVSDVNDQTFAFKCLEWMESRPGWATGTPIRREITAYLLLNEANPQTRTLTSRPVREMAVRTGWPERGYTPDQIKKTLTWWREAGLAYPKQEFEDSNLGWGRVQTASRYYLATDRLHVKSEKRQEAARRGLRAVTPGSRVRKIPYSLRDDAAIRRQMRNRSA